ncbi:MAG: helix-turn-helix domain-containing protein [Notoacmeibacter sp.]|nr:helix-turn-helix domain-containing protein [Notoacmeibacter sp.]
MAAITKPRGYAIGRVSAKTGVNVETIRYYERIGIMPKPDRTRGGNRVYDSDLLKRLHFIRRCRGLGFSIGEIRTLLAMVDRRDLSCNEVHRMTVGHLSAVRQKIADLNQLAGVLDDMASVCSRGNVPECPIIDALFESGGHGEGTGGDVANPQLDNPAARP